MDQKMPKNGHLSKNRIAHPIMLGMPFPKIVLLLTLGQIWPKHHQMYLPAFLWNAPFKFENYCKDVFFIIFCVIFLERKKVKNVIETICKILFKNVWNERSEHFWTCLKQVATSQNSNGKLASYRNRGFWKKIVLETNFSKKFK